MESLEKLPAQPSRSKQKLNSPEFAHENKEVQGRIKDTCIFMDSISTWLNDMMKLSTPTGS